MTLTRWRWPALLGCLAWAGAAWADAPYRGGVVATQSYDSSEAALSMLKRDGNAVDAAVAAAFVLGVVQPYHSGLGGGGFALVHQAKSGESSVLDFREVAPMKATPDMFLDDQRQLLPGASTVGALSVAVPGAPAGYLELHARFGRLPLSVVMAPAIRLAEGGFWVTPEYADRAEGRFPCLSQQKEAARIFLSSGEGGSPAAPPVKARIRQKDLARTMRRLSRLGWKKGFYTGPVAQAVARTVQKRGGRLSVEDLAAYRPRWRKPLWGQYRGYKIAAMPPPSSGGIIALQALTALEQRYPEGVPYREPQALHYFVEVLRRLYWERSQYMGDPAFADIPVEKLLSPEHVRKRVADILPDRASKSEALEGTQEEKHTTHISVLDRKGNAVALTTTVNYYFGSCLVAEGTGVLLNDEMDDFTTKPGAPNAFGLVSGKANDVAPGKIPASSMSPTLVFQKKNPSRVLMALGSPGGSTIPTTVLQVIMNVIDHQLPLARAVSDGRIHHQYLPDVLRVDEKGLEPATVKTLEAMGHRVTPSENWGNAQAVMEDEVTGLRYSASDARYEGAAMGED